MPTYTLRPLEWSTITPRLFCGTVGGPSAFIRYSVSQVVLNGRWSLFAWMSPQPVETDYATAEGARDAVEDHYRRWAEANVVEEVK